MSVLYELKLVLRNNPTFFRTRWKRLENPYLNVRVLRRGDDLVIEGFPRSANTFATYAFFSAQPGQVRVANHFHSPAQFILARRYGVPAMLVLREPLAAAASLVLFDPRTNPERALRRYIAFHRPLLRISDAFVVAPFEEVISDFGASIDRLNRRFGTSFARFVHEDRVVKEVEAQILSDKHMRGERLHKRFHDPLRSTLPNAEKEAHRAAVIASFETRAAQRLLDQAREQYHTLKALIR